MKKKTEMTQKRRTIEDARVQKRQRTMRMRQETAEKEFLDSLHFADVAKELQATHRFYVENESDTRIRQFRGVLRREMKMLFLRRFPKEKRTRAEQRMLFLLEKTEKIELTIWDNRKSKFTIEKALEMYRAAAEIEKAIFPGLPQGKEKIAEKVRRDIGLEINKLKKIRTDTPDKTVKVDGRLLSIATKAAGTRITSVREKAGHLAKRGFGRIDRTVEKALPLKKQR